MSAQSTRIVTSDVPSLTLHARRTMPDQFCWSQAGSVGPEKDSVTLRGMGLINRSKKYRCWTVEGKALEAYREVAREILRFRSKRDDLTSDWDFSCSMLGLSKEEVRPCIILIGSERVCKHVAKAIRDEVWWQEHQARHSFSFLCNPRGRRPWLGGPGDLPAGGRGDTIDEAGESHYYNALDAPKSRSPQRQTEEYPTSRLSIDALQGALDSLTIVDSQTQQLKIEESMRKVSPKHARSLSSSFTGDDARLSNLELPPPIMSDLNRKPPRSSVGNLLTPLSVYPLSEEFPLPPQPPYIAHVGNMSLDTTSADLTEFFKDCTLKDVRIPEDKFDNISTGFCYVDFGTFEGLKKALSYSGSNLGSRMIRVSVVEPFGSTSYQSPDLVDTIPPRGKRLISFESPFSSEPDWSERRSEGGEEDNKILSRKIRILENYWRRREERTKVENEDEVRRVVERRNREKDDEEKTRDPDALDVPGTAICFMDESDRSAEHILHQSTLGGIVVLDGIAYSLTVAHPLLCNENAPPKSSAGRFDSLATHEESASLILLDDDHSEPSWLDSIMASSDESSPGDASEGTSETDIRSSMPIHRDDFSHEMEPRFTSGENLLVQGQMLFKPINISAATLRRKSARVNQLMSNDRSGPQYKPDSSQLPHNPTTWSSASVVSLLDGYSLDPEIRRHHHHRTGRASSKDHIAEDSLVGGAAGGLTWEDQIASQGTIGGGLARWIGERGHGKYKGRKEERNKEVQRAWERRWSKGTRDWSSQDDGIDGPRQLYRVSLEFSDDEMDWAICEISKKSLALLETTFGKYLFGATDTIADLPSTRTRVYAQTRRGNIFGFLDPAPYYLQLGKGLNFVETLEVILDEGNCWQPGDCGTWIHDATTHHWLGHLVSGDDGGKIAHIIPARHIKEDIEKRLHVRLGMPT